VVDYAEISRLLNLPPSRCLDHGTIFLLVVGEILILTLKQQLKYCESNEPRTLEKKNGET
jgi:hypothetical protein